jgi:amino acid adenylation domain-containing protein
MSATASADAAADRRELVELLLRQRLAEAHDQDRIRPRANDAGPVPVTLAQHLLWVMERLSPWNGLYNETTAVSVRGRLDLGILERSANSVIRRHEVLRTGIALADGRPVQVVSDEATLTVGYQDLRTSDPADPAAEALQRCRQWAAEPFDLRRPPLVRMLVVRTADAEHVVAWTMHHIVSDGWSLGIFARELMAAYRAILTGEVVEAPPLLIQYGDYARWEERAVAGGRFAKSLDYWRTRLSDMPQTIDLPTDHPRPRSLAHAGASHTFDLPRELVESMRRLALDSDATLFMVLLAAFQVLLGRLSGQDDFGVGTPVANRNRVETEGLIGCFLNLLVLRADLRANPTFRELLGRVRPTVIAAFQHGEAPFELLAEELRSSRDPGRSPLFQVLFVLHNQQIPLPDIPGLDVSFAPGTDDTAKYNLTLEILDHGSDVRARLEYDTSLFDAATVRAMAERLVRLLRGIVTDPDRRIGFLPFVADTERAGLAATGALADEDDQPRRCLHELFEDQAARTPEAVAVVGGGRQITYADLDDLSGRVAARLAAEGVRPGSFVALCFEQSVDTIVAILAALRSGAAYVPIDPAWPAERIRFVLDDTGASLVLSHAHLTERLPSPCPVLTLDEALTAPHLHRPAAVPRVRAGDLAYVIYTSGSTGTPKGVAVEHRQACRLVLGAPPELRMTAADVVAQFSSYTFDVSVWEIWAALASGARLVVVPEPARHDPALLQQLLAAERVTAAFLTPTAFSGWLKVESAQPADALALRLIGLAGERLDFTRLGPWFDRHPDQPELWNIWGPTEIVVYATARRLCADSTLTPRSLIGWAFPDLRVEVLDRNLQPVPAGVVGQIAVSGGRVARGYLRRPELTADVFVPDPDRPGGRRYLTGDLARRLPDGDLEFLGRVDGQVKLRGHRIELGEVEAALRSHPAITDTVVVLASDEIGGHLTAYLVADDDHPPSVSELRAFVQARLPHYMVPSAYVYIDAVPRNSSGKVDCNALPSMAAETAVLGTPYAAPRSGLEQVLVDAWTAVLRVDRVGIDDDFFDLGGHSVAAIQLQDLLREQAVELDIAALFEQPTVRSIAERIVDGGSAETIDQARRRADQRRAAGHARAARGGKGRPG